MRCFRRLARVFHYDLHDTHYVPFSAIHMVPVMQYLDLYILFVIIGLRRIGQTLRTSLPLSTSASVADARNGEMHGPATTFGVALGTRKSP